MDEATSDRSSPWRAQPIGDGHPLVALTQRRLAAALRRRPVGSDDAVVPLTDDTTQCLELWVRESLIARALCVADAVIKALEAHDFTIDASFVNRSSYRTAATLGRETIVFRIVEQMRQVKHQMTKEERDRYEREPRWTKIPKWDKEPMGLLELQYAPAEDYGWKSKRESTRRTTDEMAGAFVAGVIALAAREKVKREERERHWEELRLAEKRRREEEQRAQEEDARVEGLIQAVSDWEKAKGIRAYAAAVRAAARAMGQKDGAATELGQWLAWAEEVAARHDPLSPEEGSAASS